LQKQNLIKLFMYTFLKLCRSYIFILYILCFKITETMTVKGDLLDFYCTLLRVIFVLTCLRMAYVQTETCSIYVKVTN
jgi:hypothetical protein